MTSIISKLTPDKIIIREDLVLVRINQRAGRTASGIYLEHPEGLPENYGTILQIGVQAREDAKLQGYQVGDRVLFQRYAGSLLTEEFDDGEDLMALEPKDFLARFVKEEETQSSEEK